MLNFEYANPTKVIFGSDALEKLFYIYAYAISLPDPLVSPLYFFQLKSSMHSATHQYIFADA